MRSRVSSLTSGLPRRARDTVAWDTPARWAMSIDVALALLTAAEPLVRPASTTLPSAGRGVPAPCIRIQPDVDRGNGQTRTIVLGSSGGATDEYAGDASRPGNGTARHSADR